MENITKYFCKLELKYYDKEMMKEINHNVIDSSNFKENILKILYEIIGKCPNENLIMISFDYYKHINAIYVAGVGSKDKVASDMAQMLSVLLLSNAESVVVAHNHPGLTDPVPSFFDIQWHKRFKKVLYALMMFNFEEYVISQNGYYDMKEGRNKDGSYSKRYHYKNKKGKWVYGLGPKVNKDIKNIDLSFLDNIEGE